MSKQNGKDRNPLSMVAIVAMVCLTICFLSLRDYGFWFSRDKEKIEVTAYNSNLVENDIDM